MNERGFYVPAFYDVTYAADGTIEQFVTRDGTAAPPVVRKAALRATDAVDPPATRIFTPETEFGSRFLVEVVRGCANLCRFCWAGYNYLPVRAFPKDRILELAKQARPHSNRVGLVSIALCDHPQIEEILTELVEMGYSISPASLRLDDLTPTILRLLRQSGERTITIAPETGSDRLRRVINKTMTNDEILAAADSIFSTGFENLKLYFMSLLRVYENGKPASTPDHLSFEWGGAKEGEPVFVAGHPGTTQRLLTVAQLKTQRDVYLPFWLLRFSELRGRMIQYSKTSAEADRTSKDFLSSVENAIKVRRMQLASLLDDRMMEQHAAAERKLRDAVTADATAKTAAGSAWDDIAGAEQRYREILIPYTWLEGGAGFNSELFNYARQLLRAADERAKPNTERLREYTDTALARLKPALEAPTPVYPAFEELRLSFSLERMREYLGPDHAMVKAVLGAKSPDERAHELVSGSSLADPKARMKLFEGGAAALHASTDPMIALARDVDAESRRLRKTYEEVQGIEAVAQQKIADARFKIYGKQLYPDATFTLRLSYAAVAGWNEAGMPVDPFTRLDRMYARATGAPPFELPKPWLDSKPQLNTSTRVNFTTTNDIVGGNSGSPIVNAAGRIVGLAFDGNIHSIAGSYWFDPQTNRTVGVHPEFMRTALAQVYQVTRLTKELGIQ